MIIDYTLDIHNEQDNIRSLQDAQQNTSKDIFNLQVSKTALEQQKVQCEALQQQVPGIEDQVTNYISRVDKLIEDVITKKNMAIDMALLMGDLDNKATQAAHESLFKNEFLNAILAICSLAAIDKSRVPEITGIVTEVSSGYEGEPIPPEERHSPADMESFNAQRLHE